MIRRGDKDVIINTEDQVPFVEYVANQNDRRILHFIAFYSKL